MSVKDVQKTSGVPYTKKTAIHTDEKILIAQKAARLVETGSSVFLDAGSTALYLAKEMPDISCSVFTNGLAVATELSKKKNVAVNLLGGTLIKENLSTASSLASVYFTDMNFEIAIIAAAAFTPESGFWRIASSILALLTCVYICVVLSCSCPRISLRTRTSTLPD